MLHCFSDSIACSYRSFSLLGEVVAISLEADVGYIAGLVTCPQNDWPCLGEVGCLRASCSILSFPLEETWFRKGAVAVDLCAFTETQSSVLFRMQRKDKSQDKKGSKRPNDGIMRNSISPPWSCTGNLKYAKPSFGLLDKSQDRLGVNTSRLGAKSILLFRFTMFDTGNPNRRKFLPMHVLERCERDIRSRAQPCLMNRNASFHDRAPETTRCRLS